MKRFLSWKFSIFVETEDAVLATRYNECSRACWCGSNMNDTLRWWLQWLLGKVEASKKQKRYGAENNPKYLTPLQVALFRLLVVRCKTGLTLLPKTHPALLRFKFPKNSALRVPSNFGETCGNYLLILLLWTSRERCNSQWSGAIAGSSRGPTFFAKSWPNSRLNEMGLEISLRRYIINTLMILK